MNTPLASCTVLVVDSCRETQAQIFGHLQNRGFSVITAADPTAALATIELTAPDIVLTDSFLPEGSGLTLIKTLRSRHVPCPVIMMAEHRSEQTVLLALRAGAVDYLHKPVGVEELAHALQRARYLLPADMADTPGLVLSDYTLTTDSDPEHIPGMVSWLLRATAGSLSETTQLHLRGTLQELLLNSVEHGNLEISYQVKQRALDQNRFSQLVQERLAQPRLAQRTVTIHVHCDRRAGLLEYRIVDQGKGFQWKSLLHRATAPCNAEDASGRGIFLARSFFPNLRYNDRGNEVTVPVPIV
ncbi:MAG: response regulator [Nitrospira sp. CG24D]|nr:MAG: response regulator [Nitrospira sp. CG24D]